MTFGCRGGVWCYFGFGGVLLLFCLQVVSVVWGLCGFVYLGLGGVLGVGGFGVF